jgi:hypothetical protein
MPGMLALIGDTTIAGCALCKQPINIQVEQMHRRENRGNVQCVLHD